MQQKYPRRKYRSNDQEYDTLETSLALNPMRTPNKMTLHIRRLDDLNAEAIIEEIVAMLGSTRLD